MPKLRVLFVGSGFNPLFGGPAFSEAALCQNLGKSCDVDVICPQNKIDPGFARKYQLNPRLFTTTDVIRAWLYADNWLNHQIKLAGVMHLNGHWNWKNYFFARLSRRHGVPYILHPRGMLLVGHRRMFAKKLFNRILGNWLVRNAERVIALSHFEIGQFQSYAIPDEKIVVIPNAISMPAANYSAALPLWEAPYFLYLGRLEARKNLLFLVEAFQQYVQRSGTGYLYLMGPTERDYDRQILAKVATLGLQDRVRVAPPIYDDKKWIYVQNAVAVIYPSYEEPFGRVPFEAVLAGTPAIVPDRSGGAEYLAKFVPACIYPATDASALAETLARVERRGPQFERSFAQAQDWVKKTLNWPAIADRMVELYQAVLKRPAPLTRTV